MNFLAYFVHDLNPYAFQFWYLSPRWYGIAYLLGFLFAYLLITKLSKDGMLRLNPERMADMVLNCCIFGVLIGGRLGFVLFYDLPNSLHEHVTPLLWDFSSAFPFWGVLRVWKGGMSAHGGIVFTILTLIWFSRQYKKQGANLINIGDASCMVVPIGLFFGRCANFINGELYGHITTVSWAVKFPSEIWAPTNGVDTISDEALYPAQRSITEYLQSHWQDLTARQVTDFLANPDHRDFRTSMLAQVGPGNLNDPAKLDTLKHAMAQYVGPMPGALERWDLASLWQGPHNGLWSTMRGAFDTLLPARHPSQLYEALLEGVALFIICWTIGRLWRKDGMASGAFLTLYPVMRIIGEQFRIGDTSLQIGGMRIGEGILLSVPLVLAGAIYWGYWIHHDRRIPWKPYAPADLAAPNPPAQIP